MSNILQKSWDLNIDKLLNISNELFNSSWDTFRVTEANTNRVPVSAGIYMFTASVKGKTENDLFKSLKTPMYIGISEVNIRDRYRSHWKKPNFTAARASYDPYFEFSCKIVTSDNIKYLREWEDALIRTFGPTMNSINSITNSASRSDENNA